MKVSIALTAGHADARIDWVIEGIAAQAKPDDEIELVIVDVFDRQIGDDAEAAIAKLPNIETFTISVVPPKPTIWQGEFRATSRDLWALASARNTALVLARYDYIAFVTDRCRLGPKWLDAVRQGHLNQESVIAGTYDRLERGKTATDVRRSVEPSGKIDCSGSWLFGCTFALPIAWALRVNGFEEGCDGLGGDDHVFGLMLKNAGYRIDFSPDLLIEQDRNELAPDAPQWKLIYHKIDKGVSPNDKTHAALARFGKRKVTEFTPDLTYLRHRFRQDGIFFTWPVPYPDVVYRDWYDEQPIKEM